MQRAAPDQRVAVSSLLSLSFNLAFSVGAYLSGLIQTRGGFGPVFVLAAALYAVAWLLVYVFFAQTDHKKMPGT